MEGVVRAREESTSKSEEVGNIRQYILSTIEAVVGSNSKNMVADVDYSNTTLPKQWENYISFCDLVFVAKHVNRMNWTTFLLQDYPKELHIPPNAEENKENTHRQNNSNIPGDVMKESRTRKYLPIEKIRKRFKKLLLKSGACNTEDEEANGDIAASVQADSVPLSEINLENLQELNLNTGLDAASEMLLIRITTTRKTRHAEKDAEKILSR